MNPLAPPIVLSMVAADASSSAIVGWEAIDDWATINVDSWRVITDMCGSGFSSVQDRACSLAVGMLGEFLSAKAELHRYHRTFGPFLVDLPDNEAHSIEKGR